MAEKIREYIKVSKEAAFPPTSPRPTSPAPTPVPAPVCVQEEAASSPSPKPTSSKPAASGKPPAGQAPIYVGFGKE